MSEPKLYIKARTNYNANPPASYKRDADYWENDMSDNLFYMSGNVGVGYPIPYGKLTVDGNVGIGTNTPQAALDVSGNIYMSDGTATAPVLTFSSDTNTGFYRAGADTLGIVTGGTERVRVDASGNTSFTGNVTASGNVGIGTTMPQAKIHIMDTYTTGFKTTAPLLLLENPQGNRYNSTLKILDKDNNDVNGTVDACFTIDMSSGTGQVNLLAGGETINGAHVYTSSRGASRILMNDANMQFYTGTLVSGGGQTKGTPITWNNPLTIDICGNVGIGASNPQSLLDVNGNARVSGTTIMNGNAKVSGTTIMNGNVGIGTTMPDASLHVRPNTSTAGVIIDQVGSGSILDVRDGGVSKVIMDANGNVGIGTTTPHYTLDVSGNINFTGSLTSNNAPYLGIGDSIPVGAILPYYSATISDPSYLICDGATYQRSQYVELANALGVSPSATNFTVPDLRDRFLKGKNADAVGATGGSATKTLTEANMPAHSHSGTTTGAGSHQHGQGWFDRNSSGGNYVGNNQYFPIAGINFSSPTPMTNASFQHSQIAPDHTHTLTTDSKGSGTAFDIRPPYSVVIYIIKAKNNQYITPVRDGDYWTNVSNQLIYQSGNVGIGTTAPQSLLDVNGNAKVSGTTILNGNVGIGTTNPLQSLHISGNNPNMIIQSVNNASFSTIATPGIVFRAANTTVANTTGIFLNEADGLGVWANGAERMRFKWNGYVGIGTTNPIFKLHIASDSLFIGDTNYTSTTIPSLVGNLGIPNYNRLIFDNTFNGTPGSGIGANKIVLHNNDWLAGFGLEGGAVTYHSGDRHRFYTTTNNTTTYGTKRFTVNPYGIVLHNPSYTFQLNVTLGATGGDEWIRLFNSEVNADSYGILGIAAYKFYHAGGGYTASDRNLKTNITPFDESMINLIRQLVPVKYNWNSEFQNCVNSNEDCCKEHIGFIAQDVQPLFPELVTQGPTGHLGIDYAKISPLAIAYTKYLEEKVTLLETSLNALKLRLDAAGL